MMKRRIGALALATSLLLAGATAPAFADETSPDSPVGVTAGSGDDEVAESGATVERDGEGEVTQSGEGAEPSADAEVTEVEEATAPAAPSVASATGDPEGTVVLENGVVKLVPTVTDGKVVKWRAVVTQKPSDSICFEEGVSVYTYVGSRRELVLGTTSDTPGTFETDLPFGVVEGGSWSQSTGTPECGSVGLGGSHPKYLLTDTLPVQPPFYSCDSELPPGAYGDGPVAEFLLCSRFTADEEDNLLWTYTIVQGTRTTTLPGRYYTQLDCDVPWYDAYTYLGLTPPAGMPRNCEESFAMYRMYKNGNSNDSPSQPAGPSVTVSAGSGEKVSSVVQGARVVLRAHGFRAGEEVTFEVHSDVVTLGTVRADAEGTATWEGTLPASVLPGEHRVIARGAVSGEVSIPLTVTAPTAAAGGLADTGVSAATAPAGAMALLLALGGCAGLVARRRLLG